MNVENEKNKYQKRIKIRNNLKYHRLKADLSQPELAKRIGCTNIYICNLESGIWEGRLKFWRKISEALGVKLGDLLD